MQPSKRKDLLPLGQRANFLSHSDVHFIKGDIPMTTNIPGHEGVGRVVQGRDGLLLVFGLLANCEVTVGPGTPTGMIGKRVGVKCV